MNEIYVRLLEEGTTVYRPVMAEKVGDSLFLISMEARPDDDDDEVWEFPPGSKVVAELVDIGGNKRLLATRLIES